MRFLLFGLLLSLPLLAQTTPPPSEQKPPVFAPAQRKAAMPCASPQFGGKQSSGFNFCISTEQAPKTPPPRFVTRTPAGPITLATVSRAKSPAVCSIPLLNVLKADPHDRIAVTPPAMRNSPKEIVIPPAPPCDDNKR